MVNTINTQTIHDGDRNYVIKVDITGDGSGEETSTALVDVSAIGGAPDNVKITRITGNLTGFSMTLEWDATANLDAHQISSGEVDVDFSPIGGLVNNAGSGKTGDIDFSTVGLGAADVGSLVIEMKKRAA